MTAGSACATPRTTATLNSTSPVAAIPASHSHSRPRGMCTGTRAARARANSSSAAAAYRTAWVANSGASTSARETVTLLPTNAIPAIPGTRSRSAVEPPGEFGESGTEVGVEVEVEAGRVCMGSSLAAQWPHEQVQSR